MRWRLVDTNRYEVLERGYNSPIPDPRDLPPQREPYAMDVDRQRPLFRDVLNAAERFEWEQNDMYGPLDSKVLYGLLCHIHPRRVVELGSGSTTRIIRQALGEVHDAYDPFTKLEGVKRLRAQEVPMDAFMALGENDVLFVDTTHIVRTGGDVNRIILDVMPRLRPGVWVHFHDILLPKEVDQRWLDNGWYWTEQYLLEAFLIGNDRWKVELAVNALSEGLTRPDELASAFWVRSTR